MTNHRSQLDAQGPLYMQVFRHLQARILKGEFPIGATLPKTTELCQFYGVTTDTIQKASTHLAGQGFIKRVQRRGSFVTNWKTSRTICLLTGIKLFRHSNAELYLSRVEAIHEFAQRQGMHVEDRAILDDDFFEANMERLQRDIDEGRYGCILLMHANGPLHKYLSQLKIPVLHRQDLVDYHELAYRLTSYLIGRGCRSLLAVTPINASKSTHPIYQGAMAALQEHGYAPEALTWHECTANEAGGQSVAKQLVANGDYKDKGILSLNDVTTRGLIFGLMQGGVSIPRDAALITHANKGCDILSPTALTRLEYDPCDLSQAQVEACKSAIDDVQPTHRYVKPHLVIGKSCGEHDTPDFSSRMRQ